MFKNFLYWFLAALLTLVVVGCSDANKVDNTLTLLKQGKASGELILHTDGRVGVGQSTFFTFGAEKAGVSFAGRVDYSEDVSK